MAPTSTSKYPKLSKLRADVKKSYVTPDEGRHKSFLPIDSLKELVTRDTILSAFREVGEPESAELERIIEYVLHKCERVFLVLVLMTHNGVERLSSLKELQRKGFDDTRLPLELSDQQFSNEMPKDWEENDFELFRAHQWPLIAPVFGTKPIHDLKESQPLPFIYPPSAPKGQGFFGEVSRAEIHEAHIIEELRPAKNVRSNNCPKGIAVAIKKAKDSQELTEFFQQEMDGLWRTNELNSRHIIKIIAAYRRGSDKCLLFLWADGGNFTDYWREHNQSRNMETIRWSMKQVLCLCGRHGDLKPENILWFKDDGMGGCLKIADLGLSKFHEVGVDTDIRNKNNVQTNTPSGTSRYEPPEMDKDRMTKDARTRRYDIWSMGCIMTELLVWFLYGINGLETFRSRSNTPYFWQTTQGENHETVYYVNPYVSSCLDIMEHALKTNSAYDRLLKLVRNKLLVVRISEDTSSGKSRAKAREMYDEMLEIERECPFDSLPQLPADLIYPDTQIRDQSHRYTRLPYRHGMLSPNGTKGPVQALPSFHNQPVDHVNNLGGKFTPELVLHPPDETPGPTPSAIAKSNVTDKQEFTKSGIIDNQEQSTKLNDIWESVPDNGFAKRFFAVLPWDRLQPASGCQDTNLCASCSAINSPQLFHPVIYSHELKSSSKYCSLCSMLHSALIAHEYDLKPEISLYQDGSVVGIKDGPSLLSVYAEPDRPIQQGMQLGLPRLPDACSQEQFLLLKEWIKVCDTTHSSCGRPEDNTKNGRSTLSMPTRLLKLDKPIQLVESGKIEPSPYVALSHCWGKVPEAGRLCTFQNNMTQLTQCIEFNALPKTFRDAIQVTQGIGINYLWIDSLCIIQDDRADWERESARMEQVFSSAYCTIAASSSKSSAEGFLDVRQPRRCVQLETANMGKLYVCQNIDNFHRDVDLGELNSRGWVMQERVLSRRTIFYTSTQVYWECGAGVHCETLARLKNAKAALVGDAKFPHAALEYYRDGRQMLLQDLYERYSRLAFTNYWDRPVAILGLQERLARALGTRGAYGVFAEYFARLLLWKRYSDEAMERLSQLPEYKWRLGAHHDAPTWSWFSKIQWETADFKNPFKSSENQGRDIKTFDAKARKFSLSQDGVRGCIILDEDQDVVVNDLRCVIIGRGRFRDSAPDAPDVPDVKDHVLVIRNVAGSDRYERVGVASLKPEQVAIEGSWVTIE
ncbi:hypothetical protein F5Y19DRAFT_461232 [Xylariaceae sp. FL1651]|nr:hypothetical protein F5Y19DRAFT_461232 [Xylariaceae sp. FL1651]